MALSTGQIANFLFKVLQGKSSTNDGRQFFEEPYNNREIVFPQQIWGEVAKIPTTAPGGADGVTTGVVTRYINKALAAVPGTSNAFYHADLVDCVPFNFGDGSYNYTLSDNVGGSIPFGAGDWVVDTANGVVTFYGTVPANMPPKISYYKYVGKKGSGAGAFIDTAKMTIPYGSGPTALTGMIFPVATVKSAFIDYQMYKTAGGVFYMETGTLVLQQDGTSVLRRRLTSMGVALWDGFDLQCPFTMDVGGQLYVDHSVSLDGTAGDSSLEITFTATKVFAP